MYDIRLNISKMYYLIQDLVSCLPGHQSEIDDHDLDRGLWLVLGVWQFGGDVQFEAGHKRD